MSKKAELRETDTNITKEEWFLSTKWEIPQIEASLWKQVYSKQANGMFQD